MSGLFDLVSKHPGCSQCTYVQIVAKPSVFVTVALNSSQLKAGVPYIEFLQEIVRQPSPDYTFPVDLGVGSQLRFRKWSMWGELSEREDGSMVSVKASQTKVAVHMVALVYLLDLFGGLLF